MTSSPDPTALSKADALVRRGELAAAAAQLEAALADGTTNPAHWLQLAGLHRALSQPHKALIAVHKALALAPFDFMSLVMRAGLLDRIDQQSAGAAWEEALAQRPPGELAAPLAAAVAAGEQKLAQWRARREIRLDAASTPIVAEASGDIRWRIDRFRDNMLRKTRPYHSEPTHFHYPGLAEREFHPRDAFPWLARLEAATSLIRSELQDLLVSERRELVPYIQYEGHEALAQWQPLNRNPDWSAFHLLQQGQTIGANATQCPVTMEVLSSLPQPAVAGASPNAMFSLLAPKTAIPPHVGIDNSRLVCHLPLIVPPGCWFRVGAETRHWEEGSAFVFDDTIEHEADNPSDQLRVVLIFDVWHPGLSAIERAAVAAMIAADGDGS